MTAEELHERQGWSLDWKIDHALGVIDQFISRMDGKVYLAFSGGKDSTVLMHLCEIIKKDILCVFVNTGCEYLDIIRFVNECQKDGHNIKIIRPEYKPREVWEKYGFPIISKRVANCIRRVRSNPNNKTSKLVLGELGSDTIFTLPYKWRYLINEPYDTSDMCCQKLKKDPSYKFQKEYGLYPILGIMASESLLREKTYIRRGGCNVWGEDANSHPLSIWTDDDIWQFIRENNIKIADIYNKGAQRTGCAACGFGCQFKNDHRLELLYNLYPKYYNMVMGFKNNGVTYREALRKMLAVNGLVLPDEDNKMNF